MNYLKNSICNNLYFYYIISCKYNIIMKEITNYLIHFIEQEFLNKEKKIFMNQSKKSSPHSFQKLFLDYPF